jgi:hypothetical protein
MTNPVIAALANAKAAEAIAGLRERDNAPLQRPSLRLSAHGLKREASRPCLRDRQALRCTSSRTGT